MSRRDEDVQLSPLLRSLVAAERRRPGLDPGAEARLQERIEASLDWIDAQPPSGAPRAGTRRRTLLAAAVLLATLAGGAAAHSAYVAVVARRSRSVPAPPQPPAPTTPAPAQAAPPPPAAPAVEQEVVAPSRHPSASRVPSDGRRAAHERELLEMARTALGLQRLPEAQAALELHEREFPAGQLAEERESLAVQLLLAQGELERARARAARFHERHPRSIFWPSMERQLDQAAGRGE